MTITDKQVEAACIKYHGTTWHEYADYARRIDRERMRALLVEFAESATGAAGFVRVPLEPTEAMIDAAQSNSTGGLMTREARAAVFRAMASASPSSAEQPATAPVDAGGFAQTGDSEADAVINRLNSSDPDFDDCAAAAALIYRLVADRPDGYPSWKDAAIAERTRRVAAERTAPGAPEADERARFEAWAGSEGFITQRDQFTFGYYATVTNDAWEVWQARAQSSAAPSVAPVSTRDGEPFGWAVVDKNGCTERVVSRVHYEFNCAEPVIRAGVAHDLLPYLDREYRGAAPHRIVTLYTAPPADARDSGRALLRQAIDAMSKLRQSLEFPGKHGGLYVFPEHAVRKFTDEQARLMYEEKRLAEVAQECVTDSARLEFVMQKFPGSAARDAGITWSANTIDDYRAAIDRAMGGE